MAVGQLANTATALLGAAPVKGPVNIYLYNSGGGTNVVIFTYTPAGGSDQVLKQVSLATLESGELVYVPANAGDTVKAQATTGAQVNYITQDVPKPSGGAMMPPMEWRGYSALGARKYNSV